MGVYFKAENLSVGYGKKALISEIEFEIEKGSVLTLIGPNGAGKSTILKTITRQLSALNGTVYVSGEDIHQWTPKKMSKHFASVLTERIQPELTTCAEVVAMGRYPYTDFFGRLTDEDMEAIDDALEKVNAKNLAGKDFSTLSDGQKQRILIARAICQQPDIIVLDEPTAYLDIRHKIELLDILSDMAKKDHITVIMSLHEIDLAIKISDYLMCVKGEHIAAFGKSEDVFRKYSITELFDMDSGSYNQLLGSVELKMVKGEPRIFVIGGNGCGIPFYRELQKKQIPFAAGILFENDIDYPVASALSDTVICAPAFSAIEDTLLDEAIAVLGKCDAILDTGVPVGEHNRKVLRLFDYAKQHQIPVITDLGQR